MTYDHELFDERVHGTAHNDGVVRCLVGDELFTEGNRD